MRKSLWLICLVLFSAVVVFLAGCSVTDTPALLFDERPGDGTARVFQTEAVDSPSGAFAAEYSWDDPDTSGKYRLEIRHKSSGQQVLLGRGTRGASFRWWNTQLGDVLTVEQQEDTHFSRVFAVHPRLAPDGSFECLVLYAAPPLDRFPGKMPPEHIYQHIESVSGDGGLTLSLMWDYGPTHGVKKTLEIPLFYGIPAVKR